MKSIITTVFLIGSFLASGQRYVDTHDPKNEEVKSLLGKGSELNGFGGADLKISELKDERGLIAGAYGGVLIDRKYLLGVGGYGIATNIDFDGNVDGVDKPLNLHGGYAGIIVGGMIGSKEVIHLTFPVFFGAGSIQVSDKDFFPNSPNDAEFIIEQSAFMVVEPAAQLEFNITEYFRLAAGMSYRYITGTELDNVKDSELSGGAIMISFRFGRF
ncbi:MAG: hypothetical protein GY816_18835 [Cytophagales bacterium]|nr:hypothetical protein [Cytophagales bacterium]